MTAPELRATIKAKSLKDLRNVLLHTLGDPSHRQMVGWTKPGIVRWDIYGDRVLLFIVPSTGLSIHLTALEFEPLFTSQGAVIRAYPGHLPTHVVLVAVFYTICLVFALLTVAFVVAFTATIVQGRMGMRQYVGAVVFPLFLGTFWRVAWRIARRPTAEQIRNDIEALRNVLEQLERCGSHAAIT